MPYQQPFVDPNTGATMPQSYVRVTRVRLDTQAGVAQILAARWVGNFQFSQGMQPDQQSPEINVQGSAFTSAFGTLVFSAAEAFIGTLTTLSGATPVP